MTLSTLCIADVPISRAIAFELGRLRRCGPHVDLTMSSAATLVLAKRRCHVAGDRYFTHIRQHGAAELGVEADTARRWPAGRAGSSTHKVGGRHAARIVDRAPLRGALQSVARPSRASFRVGFGT
jgi:hypothetical protein